MFRFSIRELVLLTLAAAFVISWMLERRQNERLSRTLVVTENETQLMRLAVGSLHEDVERIEKELPAFGLKLVWSRDMRPSVQRVNTAAPTRYRGRVKN